MQKKDLYNTPPCSESLYRYKNMFETYKRQLILIVIRKQRIKISFKKKQKQTHETPFRSRFRHYWPMRLAKLGDS